ncbi:hypothetical protein FRC07_002180 [Ceratobasidium sp. 392]|nr:hypothetical protein FRC07_002180 [Ceratobasidium sp. 392]
MFFARLAIAALSFGSVAKVFAAPIAVEGYNVAIPETLPTQRRADLELTRVMTDAATKLSDLKTKIAALAVNPTAAAADPQLAKHLDQVAPILATISSSFQATGADELAQVSQDSVAKDMSLVLATTSDIVASVKGIKTLGVVYFAVENINAEVNTIVIKVKLLLPTIVGVLKATIIAVHDVLSLVLPQVGSAISDVASGGI